MATRLQHLQTAQIDKALSAWREAKLPARPASGWARSIREALGMPGVVLAKRLGITSATLRNLETAEARQAITLASLHRLAQAMDCELQYALVPRQPLAQQLASQAKSKAQAQIGPIAHTMALEDQAVQGRARHLQRDLLAQELLNGSRHKLWAVDTPDSVKPAENANFNALIQSRRANAEQGNSIEVDIDDL